MRPRCLIATFLVAGAFIFYGGPILVSASSVNVTATASTSCGDGIIQAPEQCDGANLNSATCVTLGHDGGTLSCASNCVFVTAQCTDAPNGGGNRNNNPPFDLEDFRASVIFSGRAYSFATIVIGEGPAIKASISAGASANFQTTIGTIPGTHVYSVYGIDEHGRRSPQSTFSVTVHENSVNSVSGIFLPPTIDLNRSPVKKGAILGISGLTVPQGKVSIYLDSITESLGLVSVKGDGNYYFPLNTSLLSLGPHTVQSRSLAPDTVLSGFSEAATFTLEGPGECQQTIGDFNCDGRVDVADMSVLLYWWNTNDPRGLQVADLSGDGKVGLRDMSIMFFHWTQ